MIDELRQKAEALGIKVDGRWKEAKLLQVIADASDAAPITDSYDEPEDEQGDTRSEMAAKLKEGMREISEALHSVLDPLRIDAMNAYALRIWNGQSSSELRTWRVERVKAGLTAQGWGDLLDHLSLPNA